MNEERKYRIEEHLNKFSVQTLLTERDYLIAPPNFAPLWVYVDVKGKPFMDDSTQVRLGEFDWFIDAKNMVELFRKGVIYHEI